jgi:hypothetical protein
MIPYHLISGNFLARGVWQGGTPPDPSSPSSSSPAAGSTSNIAGAKNPTVTPAAQALLDAAREALLSHAAEPGGVPLAWLVRLCAGQLPQPFNSRALNTENAS